MTTLFTTATGVTGESLLTSVRSSVHYVTRVCFVECVREGQSRRKLAQMRFLVNVAFYCGVSYSLLLPSPSLCYTRVYTHSSGVALSCERSCD